MFLLGADRIVMRPPSPVSSPRENNSKATPTSAPKSLAIPLPAPSPTSTLQRRWSQTQAKDFHDLHTTLATMILKCDLSTQNYVKGSNDLEVIPIPAEVAAVLFGHSSSFYLQVFVNSNTFFLIVFKLSDLKI